jgi:group I intron endonuclease
MQRAWDSFGADAFEFSVLLLCDRDQLNDQENYYISLYKSGVSEKGYNIKQRAYGPGTISEETKQKISQIKMGHSVSEETRKKISDRCKNPSEEVRKRISEGKKGKKPSEETRKKLSEGQKRRFHREQALT